MPYSITKGGLERMIKNDPLPKDKIIQNPFAEENIIILKMANTIVSA